MASLHDRVVARGGEDPVLITPHAALSSAEVSGIGLSERLTPESKIALCISDAHMLMRVLMAADGQVDEMLLVSYAQPVEVVRELVANAGADVLISDRADLQESAGALAPDACLAAGRHADTSTSWLMTTSGTTGVPKIIRHTLGSLARTVYRGAPGWAPVWGQLYDPTRFAGMQVTLQALIGGKTMVAPDTSTALRAQVAMLAEHGVTHLSATPTLWRRLLMVPEIDQVPLEQITSGGEIVDQQIIDALKKRFQDARITHIYASTEAGVGFSVKDGQAGFPAAYLSSGPAGVDMKLVEDVLWLRPSGGAAGAAHSGIEIDSDGFICSGDRIKQDGERLYFQGRDSGMINIGGVKIYPEAVERVILTVPGVVLANVTSKPSPMTGALVVADVQVEGEVDRPVLKKAIQDACRAQLEREAVPAVVRFSEDLKMNAAGKLLRNAKEKST